MHCKIYKYIVLLVESRNIVFTFLLKYVTVQRTKIGESKIQINYQNWQFIEILKYSFIPIYIIHIYNFF